MYAGKRGASKSREGREGGTSWRLLGKVRAGGGTRRVLAIDHHCRVGVTAVQNPICSWNEHINSYKIRVASPFLGCCSKKV